MSRDIKDFGNLRDNVSNPSGPTPAQAMPSDRQFAREFIGALIRLAQRDVGLLSDPTNVSDRQAAAAEVAEFGAASTDLALEFAKAAAEATSVEGRAHGTLRRAYRASKDSAQLGRAYMREAKTARDGSREILATMGALQAALRRQMGPDEAIRVIEKLETQVKEEAPELRELWMLLAEDVYVLADRPVDAALRRRERFSSLVEREPKAYEAHSTLALQTAALAQVAGSSDDDVMSWLDVAFQASPSMEGARPLLRKAWAEGQLAYVEKLLHALAQSSDDADIRSSTLYQLGMLYAWRLGAVPEAMRVLNEAFAAGASSGVSAVAFIALARAQGERAFPDEFAGALSQRVECAASSMERADLLTQMAERFDADLAIAESAIELAESALGEFPGWTPALRLLGTIHARDGRWEKLIELHMRQLEFERDPDERRRLHERIAEIAQDELRDVERAESHLLAALDHGWRSSTSRRLLQIYRETSRSIELVGHLLSCARSAQIRSEKLRFFEEAAVVSETRLHDVERAIAVWNESLGVDPTYITAISALERLYYGLNRWEELLALRDHEISLTPEHETGARTALMSGCGEIAVRRLANPDLAEEWYGRALALDPLCDDALRGLGTIYKQQSRWDDLVAMTERELDRSGTPERRARCLRLIGETYVRELNHLAGAAQAYRRLGQLGSEWHEEALIWLERIYEAQSDSEKRISVLRGRRKLVASEDDPRVRTWTSRLSFRVAEVLEWNQRKPELAALEYVGALGDPALVLEAIAALDRCLATGAVRPEDRTFVLDALREALEGLDARALRAAMELLLSEARRAKDDELSEQLLDMMTEIWVADPAVVEPAALRALQRKEFGKAERIRAKLFAATGAEARTSSPHAKTDHLRDVWRLLDSENVVDADTILGELPHPLASWLAQDAGLMRGFEGADDREQLSLIQQGAVSLSELVGDDRSWISRNLSVMAARAMHDRKRLVELLEFAARQAEEPVLELRLWLDASAEVLVDAATRQRWLRQAAALGIYDHPLREDLYRALQASGDMEGLAGALVDHVYSGEASGDALAVLALRAAHAWEHLHRNADALEMLRLATVSAPSSGEVACEKSRIELLMNDVDAARETLEQALSSGCEDDRRFDVVTRLGELHLRDGGDRPRAIALLEDAWATHGQRREVGLKLAQAHLAYGDAARGAGLFESILETPIAEDDIRYWVTLGRTRAERLDEVERGEETLWSVFEAWPERNEALHALHDIAQRKQRLIPYAARLESTLQSRADIRAPRRASLWMELGQTQHHELSRFEAAEYAFASALEAGADPSVATLRRAEAVSALDRKDAAAKLLVEAVGYEEFELQELGEVAEKLDVHFSHTRDHGRSRTIRQLRRSMGVQVPELKPGSRRVAREAVSAEFVWNLLGLGESFQLEREFLVELAPLAARVNRHEKPRLELERYSPEEYREFHEAWLNLQTYLSLENLKFQIAPNARVSLWLDAETVALPGARVGSSTIHSVNYHAGWVAGVSFAKLAPFIGMTDAKIRDLIAAVAQSVGLPFEGEAGVYAAEVQTSFAGALTGHARAVKRAQAALQGAPEVALRGGEGRMNQILGIGDRVGTAFADHAGESMREVLRSNGALLEVAGAIDPAGLQGHARARALFVWMLSDSYAQLRELLGIGQRNVDVR